MLTLAIESSAGPASVALCDGDRLLAQYFQNSGLTHSRTLLQMTEDLLSSVSRQVPDLRLIAVAHGPGSFTGVRIGVSAAKGLAWGAELPVCGVSTLEAMAMQYPDPDALLCPAMDARRGEVYNALFRHENGALTRLSDDRAIPLSVLAAELRGCDKPCTLLGDGAELTYRYLTDAGIACCLAPVLLRYQTAYGVALAALQHEAVNVHALEPNYLRLSQAERERLARGQEGTVAF